MTEYIIAIIVGVVQIILSINLIVRQKNVVATLSEILSSLILLFVLNELSIDVAALSWKDILLTIGEYALVKMFLVGFMIIARLYCFYTVKAMCRKKKKKKANKLKLKFIKTFHKVKYWPKLKLGLPGMAGKTHPKTKVRFDAKGFPKFKVYYTVKLRKKYFSETRERHFYMANKILSSNIGTSTRINAKFSRKQIKEIYQGSTPSGYTWHHHQEAGVLQLVDEQIHTKTSHIGGYSIWGSK